MHDTPHSHPTRPALLESVMFRRVDLNLPEDPEYPHDLNALGYVVVPELLSSARRCRPSSYTKSHRFFINKDDEIKQIADPSQDFNYYVDRNERYNEKRKEAMNSED